MVTDDALAAVGATVGTVAATIPTIRIRAAKIFAVFMASHLPKVPASARSLPVRFSSSVDTVLPHPGIGLDPAGVTVWRDRGSGVHGNSGLCGSMKTGCSCRLRHPRILDKGRTASKGVPVWLTSSGSRPLADHEPSHGHVLGRWLGQDDREGVRVQVSLDPFESAAR